MKDPIIEEIHKYRAEYAKQFNYDIAAMFRDIQAKQSKRSDLVDLSKEATVRHAMVAEESDTYGND